MPARRTARRTAPRARRSARDLAEGVEALAHLARRGGRGHSLLRGTPTPLEPDEVMIAVAGHRSVVVRRVRIPPAKAASLDAGETAVLLEVARRAAEIDLLAAELVEQDSLLLATPALDEGDRRVLAAAGLDPSALEPEETMPLHRATAEYARLLESSYTVEEAAALLRVNASRVRQRLTGPPRTLYGIKVGGAWRLPRFQFDARGGLVPGIDRVVRALPDDVHPVALHRWLVTPSDELAGGDGAPIAPLDWLRTGSDPAAVAARASRL
jgi:hypothetical protein